MNSADRSKRHAATAAETGRRQREKGRLRQGIEGQREQRTNQRDQCRVRNLTQLAEPAPLEADRLDQLVRFGAHDGGQIEAAERHQKSN